MAVLDDKVKISTDKMNFSYTATLLLHSYVASYVTTIVKCIAITLAMI